MHYQNNTVSLSNDYPIVKYLLNGIKKTMTFVMVFDKKDHLGLSYAR